MKNKYFGKNISPDCSYCGNSVLDNGAFACKKSKQIIDGKCRAFDYDPHLRVPRTVTLRGTYTAEDFKL